MTNTAEAQKLTNSFLSFYEQANKSIDIKLLIGTLFRDSLMCLSPVPNGCQKAAIKFEAAFFMASIT